MGGGPQTVSNKERLQFIPHEEVQIQYKGDEDIYVNLRLGDLLHDDAFRCAQPLSGTTFRRLKIKMQRQPKSTPEITSTKRRECKIIETGVMQN